jgi:hypothetical protein
MMEADSGRLRLSRPTAGGSSSYYERISWVEALEGAVEAFKKVPERVDPWFLTLSSMKTAYLPNLITET